MGLLPPFATFILPTCIVAGLLYTIKSFNVKSDIRNLTVALRFSLLALLVTLLYGVVGFQLLDTHDFHQEINFSWSRPPYHLINLTLPPTIHLLPITRRLICSGSLTIISIGTVFMSCVFFQPLRLRWVTKPIIVKEPWSYYKIIQHPAKTFLNFGQKTKRIL